MSDLLQTDTLNSGMGQKPLDSSLIIEEIIRLKCVVVYTLQTFTSYLTLKPSLLNTQPFHYFNHYIPKNNISQTQFPSTYLQSELILISSTLKDSPHEWMELNCDLILESEMNESHHSEVWHTHFRL
jgi:hypothetical protein